MDDLISRKALLEALQCINATDYGAMSDYRAHMAVSRALSDVLGVVAGSPAVDAEPVRHGEWELIADCANEGVYCSNCHKKVYKADYANQKLKSKICPNCGAKMDGGA